jgi:hypothetical protein
MDLTKLIADATLAASAKPGYMPKHPSKANLVSYAIQHWSEDDSRWIFADAAYYNDLPYQLARERARDLRLAMAIGTEFKVEIRIVSIVEVNS